MSQADGPRPVSAVGVHADAASMRLVYLNLNEPPYLPPDGGHTSLPHYYLAFDGDEPVGLLAVATSQIIDLIYVAPAARGGGVARALYAKARADHKALGSDDRFTEQGLGLARALRIPFYGSGRRTATLNAADVEERGARALASLARTYTYWQQHG
jgi:GNAT superfamily N-acetyltransferase